MPSVSQSQSRAMHAAAEGKSTLGIPKSVGKDFVKADEGRKIGKLPKKKAKPKEQLIGKPHTYTRKSGSNFGGIGGVSGGGAAGGGA